MINFAAERVITSTIDYMVPKRTTDHKLTTAEIQDSIHGGFLQTK